ncbi:adenylyltransferase/cytidyltransferase family protein [Citrobacter freundii]|uniref:adenylyltransferase/cytidyltransferase family protein n=1 Tax=Citrobacter freundii TaxID=546 RepID=UPI0015E9BDFF|nr:adenylyltransferase/cytidyltransferase family protein [Citrobacter freundii]QLZ58317.1 adenylyltransferase/cytidyltransferase family protein [Citrobacter freundii]
MKTILTYGTFDVFHVGHLNLLRRARSLGDRLIVALSTDEFNLQMKNKVTAIPYKDRKEILEHLICVDLVIPETNWEQKIDDVLKYNVDVFVMGHDWEGKFDFLSQYCEVQYLKRTENISSTMIKKHISSGKSGQVLAADMTI